MPNGSVEINLGWEGIQCGEVFSFREFRRIRPTIVRPYARGISIACAEESSCRIPFAVHM